MNRQSTLCYIEKDGKYLMLHRVVKKNDVNKDKWIGVGGKFDPGETAEACALREVWEETGLTMQSPAYRGIVDFTCEPWPAERMHLYTCTDFTGTLMLRVNGVKGQDVTGVFLLVSRDTTAPVLTLSAPVFYADRAAGSYQITGTADAGSKILCGENNESVYAAGDGSFAIQGTLEERQDGDAL